jgi:peroxiredoxin
MSDLPVNASRSSADSPERVALGWGSLILPFVPIATALLVAMILRHFQPHGLPADRKDYIGRLAPDFTLRDAQQKDGTATVTLSRLVKQGPVIIIFHKGLYCPDCAVHLDMFASRMEAIRNAGIQVVAISPELPEETRANRENYPAIEFPLLWDPDNKVAEAYGLETPGGWYLDGTFVVGADGRFLLADISNMPVGQVDEMIRAAAGAGVH